MFRGALKHRLIKEVRGEGLFIAVRLIEPSMINDFISRGIKNGLLLDYFLFCNDSFRIAPPLTITDEEIGYACEIILSILEEISGGKHDS